MTKTSFIEVMGGNSRNKLIDFFIEGERHSWTSKEILARTELSESTLKRILPLLVLKEIVLVERVVGNTRLYKINKENKIVKDLYRLYNTISQQEMEKELLNQKH